MDKLQFAYHKNLSVDDATVTVLNYIYQYFDKPGSYVRALFADFSSAFNTFVPNTLVEKLQLLDVDSYLCSWISDFLSERKQRVMITSNG